MKNLLITLLFIFMLSSCAGINWLTRDNYERVKGYDNRMTTLKENFPEIYNLYINGHIVIRDLFYYTDSEGKRQIKVNYKYRDRKNIFFINNY